MYRKTKKLLATVLTLTMLLTMTAFTTLASASTALTGTDRYDTALKIAKAGWTASDTVVIARGDELADALAAAPLKAPILLTETGKLHAGVLDEVKALGAKTVYIVGGKGAVSEAVETELKKVATVERLAGADRVGTSVEIAKKVASPAGYVLANATSYADALSVSSIAAAKGMPILLVLNNKLSADESTLIAGKTVYAVGGTGVLSDAVIGSAKRLGGADRYATNAEILKEFAPDYSKIYIARGENKNLVDALAGSVLAALGNNPIVLVNGKDALDAKVADVVKANIKADSEEVLLGAAGTKAADAVEALKPKTFEVSSVSAINATQLKVVFTQPVDKTDVETNYNTLFTIDGTGATGASLGADGKTVTVTFATVEATDAILVVNPVVLASNGDVSSPKYTQVYTYTDTVKPDIAKVTATTNGTIATSLTVTATEPIVSSLAKVDGSYASVNFGGTDTATIEGLSLSNNKTHTLELINLTDKASTPNVNVSTSKIFSVVTDTAAPTVSLSAKSDKTILLTFSKSMNVASVQAALPAGLTAVKDEAFADVPTGIATPVANTNNTQFTITITDTLYTNKTSRTLTVILPNSIKDSLGNALVTTTKQIILTKDVTAPAPTGYKVLKDGSGKVTGLEVNFSEGLAVGEAVTSPVIVNSNGQVVTSTLLGGITGSTVASGDTKVTYTFTAAAKVTGIYSFSFPASLVSDLAETPNSSAAFSYNVNFGSAAGTFDLLSATGVADVITVHFGRAVKGGPIANSATDVNNYSLAGKPLPVGTTIYLSDDQKDATITLPANGVATTDDTALFTVANIKSLAGETLNSFLGTVAVVDNTKPVLNSAVLNGDGTISIGFSESLAADPAITTDIIVKVNGTADGTAEIVAGTGLNAGKYIITVSTLKVDALGAYLDVDASGSRNAGDTAVTSLTVSTSTTPTVADAATNALTGGTVITLK